MKKRPTFCLVRDATLRCAEFSCVCGWPGTLCRELSGHEPATGTVFIIDTPTGTAPVSAYKF